MQVNNEDWVESMQIIIKKAQQSIKIFLTDKYSSFIFHSENFFQNFVSIFANVFVPSMHLYTPHQYMRFLGL